MDTLCITRPNRIQGVSVTASDTARIVPVMKWFEIARKRAEELKITQEQIAMKLGVTRGAVGHWFAGRREPDLHQLGKLGEMLNLSVAEMHSQDVMPTVRAYFHGEEAPGDDVVLIKESNVVVRGGRGHELEYEVLEDSDAVPYMRWWLQQERLDPAELVRFKVDGDSNAPYLFPGDTVLINMAERQVKNGYMYAFWHEGEGRRLKRLFYRADGTLILKSWNPDYPDEVLQPDVAAEKIVIIGRVRDKSGKGGLGGRG